MKKSLALLTAFILICSSCSSESGTSFENTLPKSDSNESVQDDSSSVIQEESAETNDRTVSVYLNGELQTDGRTSYTAESGVNFFSLGVAPSKNEVLALSMVIGDSYSKSGLKLGTDELTSGELNDDAALVAVYVNGNTGKQSEYYASLNPEMFENISFSLNSYEALKSADFSLSADVTLNGKTYSLSADGLTAYTANDSTDNSSSYSDGTCLYCSGSGVCQTCNGLGYTMWGGADSRIDCTTCDGLGSCYYCQGTGIQVYASRGVLIQ